MLNDSLGLPRGRGYRTIVLLPSDHSHSLVGPSLKQALAKMASLKIPCYKIDCSLDITKSFPQKIAQLISIYNSLEPVKPNLDPPST